MTEPIDYVNVATTATVGASILIALGPTATGGLVLTAALFWLAAIALLLAATDAGGDA